MSGVLALVPILFRIVQEDSPTVGDFTSAMMRGIPPQRRERQHPGEWAGLSMFDSSERARALARQYPKLGTAIATVRLDPKRVVVWKTFGPHHFTVWGPPAAGLDAIIAVESVEEKGAQ